MWSFWCRLKQIDFPKWKQYKYSGQLRELVNFITWNKCNISSDYIVQFLLCLNIIPLKDLCASFIWKPSAIYITKRNRNFIKGLKCSLVTFLLNSLCFVHCCEFCLWTSHDICQMRFFGPNIYNSLFIRHCQY